MIHNIFLKLEERHYQRVRVNVEGIHIYYSKRDAQAYVVAVFHFSLLNELDKNQYEHIINQIKVKFKDKGYEQVFFLGILCSEKVNHVKEFCVDLDNHWILDLLEKKLIIYENQPLEYLDIRNIIEEVIEQSRYHEGENLYQPISVENRETSSRIKIFSLYNSIIIGINLLIFMYLELLGSTMDTEFMLRHGALYWPYVMDKKEWYRVFTYMFLHYGLGHLFNNMIILAFIGDNLERAVGRIRYIIIYLGTGVIAGIASMGYNMLQKDNVVAVGASGAIFGVVGGLLYVVIVNHGQLENMSARRLILFAVLSIYSGFINQGTDNVAHIVGFIVGILITIILYKKPKKSEVPDS